MYLESGDLLNNIWTVIAAILVFALMIAVHEAGHFSAAKLFGIRVNQFAIGMGPVIWKKQGKETLYSFRAIPMGGFCQMEGEDSYSDDKRSFGNAAWYKRFIVVFAGAFLNIVLGFIIFIILQSAKTTNYTTVIDTVVPNTNVVQAGFAEGDRIIGIGNAKINIYEDLSFELNRVTDKPVMVTAMRGNEKISAVITPSKQENVYSFGENEFTLVSYVNGAEISRENYPAQDTEQYKSLIGKTQTQTGYIIGFTPRRESMTPFLAVRNAFYLTFYNIKIVYVSLWELIRGAVPVSQVSGPIGIIGVIGQAASVNWTALLGLVALLTVNLGIMNLLPIPALDGCKLVLILAEAVTKKKIPPEKEGVIQLIGFGILVLVMIWATYNDIVRIFTGQ